jgi:ketopantoate reductase
MSLACGNAATLIWNVRREMPPNDSFTRRIFSATVSASPTRSAPVEADHILGEFIERGAAHGVATPLLQAAFVNLRVYQDRLPKR